MHPEIENYLVLQSLSKGKTKIIKSKGKEFVASNIDSILLYKKAVIISNKWFLLHVHRRFLKQTINKLVKVGVKEQDISHFDAHFCTKVYVTQSPDVFIPLLMKFEESLYNKKSKEE